MNGAFHLLADTVYIFHLLFIGFVVAGALLVLKWPKLAWIHIPAVTWGILVEVMDWTCPLTPLEKHFIALTGEAVYEGTFIGHYLVPLIYPDGLGLGTRLVFAGAIVVINLWVYARLIARKQGWSKHIRSASGLK